MTPYRFNPFEMDLIRRLSFNVFLKSEFFKLNRWPSVFWGDFDESKGQKSKPNERQDLFDFSRFDIDLLGCFFPLSNGEGFIEIYHDRIKDCSYEISQRLSLDFDEVRTLLQTIVLIHEIGHWFSYSCFKFKQKHRTQVFNYQTSEILETIAQLSVLWATMNLTNKKVRNMQLIMNFLTDHQSYPYKQYLRLGKNYTKKIRILKRYVELLDTENTDLDYLLLINKVPDPNRSFK